MFTFGQPFTSFSRQPFSLAFLSLTAFQLRRFLGSSANYNLISWITWPGATEWPLFRSKEIESKRTSNSKFLHTNRLVFYKIQKKTCAYQNHQKESSSSIVNSQTKAEEFFFWKTKIISRSLSQIWLGGCRERENTRHCADQHSLPLITRRQQLVRITWRLSAMALSIADSRQT